jgi:hypothetical protein
MWIRACVILFLFLSIHPFSVSSFLIPRLQRPLSLVAWRGAQSVGLHVSKHERQSLRNLFLARGGVMFAEADERAWTCEDHGQAMAVEKVDGENNGIGNKGGKKKNSKAPK